MRALTLIDGVISPATPVRRLIHKSHAAPGLSFTHPDTYSNWRVVIPLGAADFYGETVSCPTFPDMNLRGEGVCKFCGNKLDPTGKCHGRVPKIPDPNQRYSLVPLPKEKPGSPFLAAKEKPGDEDGVILFWDDSGLGDTVSYAIVGNASIVAYGHDNNGLDIAVFPMLVIKGPTKLYSTVTTMLEEGIKSVIYEYDFSATGPLSQHIHAPAA